LYFKIVQSEYWILVYTMFCLEGFVVRERISCRKVL